MALSHDPAAQWVEVDPYLAARLQAARRAAVCGGSEADRVRLASTKALQLAVAGMRVLLYTPQHRLAADLEAEVTRLLGELTCAPSGRIDARTPDALSAELLEDGRPRSAGEEYDRDAFLRLIVSRFPDGFDAQEPLASIDPFDAWEVLLTAHRGRYDALVVAEAQELYPRELLLLLDTMLSDRREGPVLLLGDQRPGRLGRPPWFDGAEVITLKPPCTAP